jgi:hypothetical protein
MTGSPMASARRGSSPNLTEKPRRARAESRLAVPREGLTRLESRRYPPCVPAWLSYEWRHGPALCPSASARELTSTLRSVFRTLGAMGPRREVRPQTEGSTDEHRFPDWTSHP